MSHFTNIKTRFQNLFYLERALNNLQLNNRRQKLKAKQENLTSYGATLVLPQSNGYDVRFSWNGKEYDLVADLSFWNQPYSIEVFINKVAERYAGEVVVAESQKAGFQPIEYREKENGSHCLTLERWEYKEIKVSNLY